MDEMVKNIFGIGVKENYVQEYPPGTVPMMAPAMGTAYEVMEKFVELDWEIHGFNGDQ